MPVKDATVKPAKPVAQKPVWANLTTPALTEVNEDESALSSSSRLAIDAGRLNPRKVLALQRITGNRAVSSLLNRSVAFPYNQPQFPPEQQSLKSAGSSQVMLEPADPSEAGGVTPGVSSLKPVDINQVTLSDEGSTKPRKISTESDEFVKNYIDNNIKDVFFWSTAFAKTDPKYRDFWVNYQDGRKLKFNLDEVPVKYETKPVPGQIRVSFNPRIYYKRNGFIYPAFYNKATTPQLIDIATTVAFNHLQREKFLEVATITFVFAIILTAYVTPPEFPEKAPGAGGLPRGRGKSVKGEKPAFEGPPKVEPPKGTKVGGSKGKVSVPETGTPGNRGASVKGGSRVAEGGEKGPSPQKPLTRPQQGIADALLEEHPGLNPKVATEASKGGKSAAGSGGPGGDVTLLSGGKREVSVHTGGFTKESIGGHLQTEAAQAGTTEIYFQINSPGASQSGLLAVIPRLKNAYPELKNMFVKFFGPDGKIWWSGVFGGPP